MKWTKTDILHWHRRALPACKVDSQRLKVSIELGELYGAYDYASKLEEIADVYIASVALWMRFHDSIGKFIFERIENAKKWEEIAKAVDIKMDINAEEREFVLVGKEWRHKELAAAYCALKTQPPKG
jgi:hypothetical protein